MARNRYQKAAERTEANAKRVERRAQRALKNQDFVRYQTLMKEVGKLSAMAAQFREKAQ
jgi:hypothetical protein